MICRIGETGTVPKYPSEMKLMIKIVNAIFDNQPLYRIDFTGLLSSQGIVNKIATAAPIAMTPINLFGTALKIE